MRPARSGLRCAEGDDIAEQERAATPERAENGQASCYRGVTWHKATRRWRANIKIKGKKIALGAFDDELQAAKAFDRAALRYRGPKTALNFSSGEKTNTKSGARKAAAKPIKATKLPTDSQCSDCLSEEERAVEIAGLPSSCKYLPMPHITELAELASNVDLQQSLLGFPGTKRKRGESESPGFNDGEGSTRELQALSWVRTKIAASAASRSDANAVQELPFAIKGEGIDSIDEDTLDNHLADVLSQEDKMPTTGNDDTASWLGSAHPSEATTILGNIQQLLAGEIKQSFSGNSPFNMLPTAMSDCDDFQLSAQKDQLWGSHQPGMDDYLHVHAPPMGEDAGRHPPKTSLGPHCQPHDLKAFALMTDDERFAQLRRSVSGETASPTASDISEPADSANSARTGMHMNRTCSTVSPNFLDNAYASQGSPHAYDYFVDQGEMQPPPKSSLASHMSPDGGSPHTFQARRVQGGRTAENYREILLRASLASAIEPPLPQATDCVPILPALTFSDAPHIRLSVANIWWRQQLALGNPYVLAKMSAFHDLGASLSPFGMGGFREPAISRMGIPMYPAATA